MGCQGWSDKGWCRVCNRYEVRIEAKKNLHEKQCWRLWNKIIFNIWCTIQLRSLGTCVHWRTWTRKCWGLEYFSSSSKQFNLQEECCPQIKQTTENCSLSEFHIPLKKWFLFDKQRFFKFQVDSYFGKGGGLKYFQLEGTRSGEDVIIKQMITFCFGRCSYFKQNRFERIHMLWVNKVR